MGAESSPDAILTKGDVVSRTIPSVLGLGFPELDRVLWLELLMEGRDWRIHAGIDRGLTSAHADAVL